MSRYRVVLEGTGFQISLEDRLLQVGFYVTRVVEADDHLSAERQAIASVQEKLRAYVIPKEPDASRIVVDSVVMIPPDDKESKSTGFAWYPTNEEDAAGFLAD